MSSYQNNRLAPNICPMSTNAMYVNDEGTTQSGRDTVQILQQYNLEFLLILLPNIHSFFRVLYEKDVN